jgi:hypothetical protein
LPRIEMCGSDDIAAFAAKLRRGGARAAGPREARRGVAEPDIVGFEAAAPAPAAALDSAAAARKGGGFGGGTAFVASDVAPREAPSPAIAAGRKLPPTGIAAQAIGFDGMPARGNDRPTHPGYARALAARLDALIGEFVSLQTRLLNALDAPVTLQKRLTTLFAQPVTGKESRAVRPGDEIGPGIVLSFDEAAEVTLTVEPKRDHSLSPDAYLNTIELAITGPGEWLSLEVAADWSDLSLAERFQLCLLARPGCPVSCRAVLRLPRKSGDPRELDLAAFELHPADGNAVLSGNLTMPDFIELDTACEPALVFTFGAEAELSLALHYLNLYFA